MAKLFSDAKPRPGPGAPRPAERTGRRSESTPAISTGMTIAEDGVWQRGIVLSFNPRTWEGSVRAGDGRKFPLAAGALARSGFVTLVPGMKCEVKLVGDEADQIKAAWH
jgi:hypothetical protein